MCLLCRLADTGSEEPHQAEQAGQEQKSRLWQGTQGFFVFAFQHKAAHIKLKRKCQQHMETYGACSVLDSVESVTVSYTIQTDCEAGLNCWFKWVNVHHPRWLHILAPDQRSNMDLMHLGFNTPIEIFDGLLHYYLIVTATRAVFRWFPKIVLGLNISLCINCMRSNKLTKYICDTVRLTTCEIS